MESGSVLLALTTRKNIKLKSNPKIKRVGTGVMWAAIGVGLSFVFLWYVVAIGTMPYNIYWSTIIAAAASAFGSLLTYMAYSIVRDSKRSFDLELTDSEAVLVVHDGLHNKKATQMVVLEDVAYAEYYPYRDTKTIILHCDYAKMEIPLWPFGNQYQDILDYLDGRGVNIVDVQSDDPMPEIPSERRIT